MGRRIVGRGQAVRKDPEDWDAIEVKVDVKGPDAIVTMVCWLKDADEYKSLQASVHGSKPWTGTYAAFANRADCRLVAVRPTKPQILAQVLARRSE